MAQRINLPYRTIPVGNYVHEILTPVKKNSAVMTMTRQPDGWPVGELFTYRIYERNRNSPDATLLTFGTESGGPSTGRDGTINPPFRVSLTWPVDKERDLIKVELDVVQAFNTAITLEFV